MMTWGEMKAQLAGVPDETPMVVETHEIEPSGGHGYIPPVKPVVSFQIDELYVKIRFGPR